MTGNGPWHSGQEKQTMSDYAFTHQGQAFTPDDRLPAETDADKHNRETEAREIASEQQEESAMQKQCIYCPTEYTVPDGAQPQSRYGTCPQCREIADTARQSGEGAEAVIELAALTEEGPAAVLARVRAGGLRGVA